MTLTHEEIDEKFLANVPKKDYEVASKWLLEKRASGLSANSIRTYCTTFRSVSNLTTKPLVGCDREDVLRVLVDVQDRFEDPTLYKHVLKDVLRRYGKEGVVLDLPRMNKRKRKRDWQDPAKLLNEKDIARMLSKTSHPRDKAILMLLWETGARNHEIASIQVGDLQYKEIRAEEETKRVLTLWLRKQKIAGEERRITLYQSTPYIVTWRKHHPDPNNPEVSLFTAKRQGSEIEIKPLGTRGIRYVVAKARKKAGINKSVRVHDFRHARATYLRRLGVPDDAIRTYMGWVKDSSMPMKYISRSQDEQMQEIAAKLGYEEELPPPPSVGQLLEDFEEPLPETAIEDAIEERLRKALRNEFDKKLEELFERNWVMRKDKSLAPLWMPVKIDSEDAVGKCTKCNVGYTEIDKRQFSECQRCGNPIQWMMTTVNQEAL